MLSWASGYLELYGTRWTYRSTCDTARVRGEWRIYVPVRASSAEEREPGQAKGSATSATRRRPRRDAPRHDAAPAHAIDATH